MGIAGTLLHRIGGVEMQQICKQFCDANAISFPGACWNWTDCFLHCVADGDPSDGVDGWINVTTCNEDD